MPRPEEITLLLQQAEQGDRDAANELFVLVQDDLKAIARKRKQAASSRVDFSTTMLVDDAFCRLVGAGDSAWQIGDRKKFFGYMSNKMHDLLIDAVRAQHTEKRGGHYQRVDREDADLEGAGGGNLENRELLLDLKGALEKFEQFAKNDALIFRLRFFLNCTFKEAAEIAELSVTEAKRAYQRAQAWLQLELEDYGHDA